MELKQLFIEHGKSFSREFLTLFFTERNKKFTLEEMFARHFIIRNEITGAVDLHDIFSCNPFAPISSHKTEHEAFTSIEHGFGDTHGSFVYSSHPTLNNTLIVAYCHVADEDGVIKITPHSKHHMNTLMHNFLYAKSITLEEALAHAIVLYFDDAAQGRKDDMKINFA